MNKSAKILFLLIFAFSLYHLLRDLLQIAGVNNLFTNIFHRPHVWCGPYCGTITLPLDLLGLFGSFVILKRKRTGSLGIIVLSSLPIWLLALLLP